MCCTPLPSMSAGQSTSMRGKTMSDFDLASYYIGLIVGVVVGLVFAGAFG